MWWSWCPASSSSRWMSWSRTRTKTTGPRVRRRKTWMRPDPRRPRPGARPRAERRRRRSGSAVAASHRQRLRRLVGHRRRAAWPGRAVSPCRRRAALRSVHPRPSCGRDRTIGRTPHREPARHHSSRTAAQDLRVERRPSASLRTHGRTRRLPSTGHHRSDRSAPCVSQPSSAACRHRTAGPWKRAERVEWPSAGVTRGT